MLEVAIGDLEGATAIAALVTAEAQAASAYWDTWAPVDLCFGKPVERCFGKADRAQVPAHWRTVGQRHSPLSGRPRNAANPANAIVNYLYTLLEAETVLACHTIELDPGLGIFHVDRNTRASFALDLMEAVRPHVDVYVGADRPIPRVGVLGPGLEQIRTPINRPVSF